MRTYFRVSCILVLAFLPECGLCQTLPYHRYTTGDGLPSNHITTLLQDSRGYLWVGTDNGLSRYDGTEFKNFTTADGLSNLYITDIIESKKHPGTFWIGTIAGGLVRMRNGQFRTFHVGEDNASSLCEDTAGTVWCSTGRGNFTLTGDSVQFVGPTDRYGSNIEELNGEVVILTHNILERLGTDGAKQAVHKLPLDQDEIIEATLVDQSTHLWAFTSEGRLFEFDSLFTPVRSQQLPLRPSIDNPPGIMDDGKGFLWITVPEEIMIVGKEDHTVRELGNLGIPFLKPTGRIIKDREGTVWFGTYAQGLVKLSEDRIYRIPVGKVTDGAYNMAACTDSNGHIWVSTEAALIEVAPSRDVEWKVFRHRVKPWSDGHMNSTLFVDSENSLWIGPITGGRESFYEYSTTPRPGTASGLRLRQSLQLAEVVNNGAGLTFAVDRFRRGWFTTSSPHIALVDVQSRNLLKIFTPADGLLADPPRALMTDHEGRLWCGAWTQGIVFIDVQADTFAVRKGPTIVEGAGVRSLYEDHEGNVWIGTRYGGLVRSHNGEYRTASVQNGLLSNAIWSLAGTDHRIWCGTDVGLEVVDKETCKPLLPKSELIGNHVYACGAYRDAYVWCLTASELVIFENPEQVTKTPPPPVYITSYVVNGVSISPDSIHVFDYTQNSCSFDFVGLSFRDEHNVRYQYRMLGHDSAWTRPVKEHTVTYASLRPGSYEFQVKAINGEGVSSTAPASISFAIVPPFWMRWWFIIGTALFILSIFYGLFRYRLYHVMNMERMRLRIASDLHDDVGTNLSSIVVSSQILEREGTLSNDVRNQLKDIRTVATTTQEMMRDIVWMLNPSNDSLDDFVLKMKEAAARLLGNIPFTFIVPSERMLEKVSIEFKRNVFLIFKETLTNVFRHSGATLVTIEVTHGNGELALQIRDNGKGFDPNHASAGSGIASLKRRADHIGGRIEFSRLTDGGTMVTLTVKNHANA